MSAIPNRSSRLDPSDYRPWSMDQAARPQRAPLDRGELRRPHANVSTEIEARLTAVETRRNAGDPFAQQRQTKTQTA